MIPVTQWFRYNRVNGWTFNHLEDLHATTTHPTPKFPSQEGWRNGTWERYHVWLTTDKPAQLRTRP